MEEGTTEDAADAPEGADAGEAGRGETGKGRKAEASTYGAMALRNVQRARKAAEDDTEAQSARTEYLMKAATVYAILDLAEALRDGGGAS